MRKLYEGNWTFRIAAAAGLCAAVLWIAGCAGQSDQQIRQQAQQATEQARADAQKAAQEAKIAAANATREANDVADGVRAGLHKDGKTSGDVVNINSASHADLETLPGVTPAVARRIASNRPYARPHDMVSKGVISQAEYDRIEGNVVAR